MSYILVFDCELSGPYLLKNGLVSLGAVLVHLDNNENFEILFKFYSIINLMENQKWDPLTLNDFWFKNENLEELYKTVKLNKGENAKVAIEKFVTFLRTCNEFCKKKGEMIIASNRLDIDCTWINYYLALFDYPPLCFILGNFIRLIDLNSYHQGISHFLHSEIISIQKTLPHGKYFSTNEATFKYLGITTRPFNKCVHNALEDSAFLAECHYLIIQKVKILKKIPPLNSVINTNNQLLNNINSNKIILISKIKK